ncbi:DUF6020 family protein [Bifidobacterium sp. ESL0769]|uniref:DUF6020 family protein n=1 Tax=Bifidobacterium sp. ESL0769 TaxID=2983229 RepID=UPI0023F9FCB7|nr:DUF6020 family protein [Bifidobacterium sp. ESL0769]WEV67892.1 DUF6020 family protein [Bifidobacterium sp. ESL0769]
MKDKKIGRSGDTLVIQEAAIDIKTGSRGGNPDDNDNHQRLQTPAVPADSSVWSEFRHFLQPSKIGLLIPVVLGFMVACSSQAAQFGWVPFDHVYLYLQAVCYAMLFAVMYMVAFRGVEFARTRAFDSSKINASKHEVASRDISNTADQRTVSKIRRYFHFRYIERPSAITADASILLCCWLPYIILLFPGVIHFDTGDQIAEYYGMPLYGMNAGKIWDHHPFLDTYLYGWFASLGKALFDNYNIGMYVYALLQAVGFAFGIAWLLAYLSKTNLNRKLLHGFAAFFCFFPVVPMCVMSIAKDTTSAMLFVPWAVMYCKLVDSKLELTRNPWFITAFALDGLLVALTKKLGLYIVVLCLLALLIGKFAAKFKATLTALAVVLFVIVDMALPKFAYQHINVVPGTPEAALALPIQMMARAAHDHPDAISDADRDAVDNYIEYSWDQIGRDYDPWLAVPAIGWTVKGKVPVSRFAKAWLDVGLRHPDSYLQGFFCLEAGWMTFDAFSVKNQPIPKPVSVVMLPMTTSDTASYTYGVLQPHTPPTEASETVKQLYRTIVDTPGINIPFFMALWTSVLPGFVLYYLWRRRKERKRAAANSLGNKDDGDLASRIIADGRSLLLKCLPWLLTAASLYVCAESMSRPGRPSPTRFVFQLVLLTPMVVGFLCSGHESQGQIAPDSADSKQ